MRRLEEMPNFEKIRRSRPKNRDDFDELVSTSNTIEDICAINTAVQADARAITESLEACLKTKGLYGGWMMERASIYEKAILNLSASLYQGTLPLWLKNQALDELYILSTILKELFIGKFPIKRTAPEDGNGETDYFVGYTILDGQGTKRVTISQKLSDYMSSDQGLIRSNCQIRIKDILGINSKGRAIAGEDSFLRCGFRYAGDLDKPLWAISIASGSSNSKARHMLIIRPLSSAIYKIQGDINRRGAFYDNNYTFHYEDSNSRCGCPEETVKRFGNFNQLLNEIFIDLSKNV